MREFLGSVVRRVFDWVMALFVRPSIKVTRFDIKETDDKKYNISFMALISNNAGKAFSVSQKCLLLFNGKKEVARIDVTRYENIKEKDICDELNILSPIDSIIMLKPGETKEIRIIDYEIERSTISKVRFSCFTGLKTCIFHLKTPQKNVCENKNTSKEKDELEKQLIWKRIKEKTKKLNSNIGAITWISTAAIAVIATGLKFMWYVYQRGKLFFWNIDASAISIIDNITLYSVFLYFLFGVVIIAIMLMPFMIVKSNKKIWKKVAEFLILSLIFAIIIYKTTGMHSVIRQYGTAGVIASGIVMLIAFVCFFSLSWALGIAFSTKKEDRENSKNISFKGVVLWGMLWLVTMVGYIGFVGYHTAMSQTDFWITKDGYAIIYETNNHFYLAEYNQEEKKPDKQHQIIINKESVEFFYNVD